MAERRDSNSRYVTVPKWRGPWNGRVIANKAMAASRLQDLGTWSEMHGHRNQNPYARHVYASRAQLIPHALLRRCECTTWPLATARSEASITQGRSGATSAPERDGC